MALPRLVTLAALKAEPMLASLALLKQSRLSVSPVRPDEFELILKMGNPPTEPAVVRHPDRPKGGVLI